MVKDDCPHQALVLEIMRSQSKNRSWLVEWALESLKAVMLFALLFNIIAITSLPISEGFKFGLVIGLFAVYFLVDWVGKRVAPATPDDDGWTSLHVIDDFAQSRWQWLVELVIGLGKFAIVVAAMLSAMLFLMTGGNRMLFVYLGMVLVILYVAMDGILYITEPACRQCGRRLQRRIPLGGDEIWYVCFDCEIRGDSGLRQAEFEGGAEGGDGD